MTDIAIHQPAAVPDQAAQPGTDLILWARQAEAAAIYAERVCSTTMAPAAYRGKPAEAAAAILAGAELGFSPMASLRAFDSIQGVPAPKAMTLRAVAQKAGHEVEIVESTNERAVVRGRRHGRGEWQTSVWDVKRAEQLAQYKNNAMYRTNRAQMLTARATAEVVRWIASDAVMGMPYAAEEVGDQPEIAPAPAVRKLSPRDLDGMTLDEVADAAHAGAKLDMVTREQQRHMFALWNELGYVGDANRAKRLELTAKFLGLESIESSDDLTSTEANVVIAKLQERKAQVGATDA